MPDLDPAHVEAVAEAVASPDHLRDYWRDVARAILTSTDPDVRLAQFLGLVEELDPAALLAALVRAGVLEEFTEYGVRRRHGMVGSVAPMDYRSIAVEIAKVWDGTLARRGRYVTRWEDADVD